VEVPEKVRELFRECLGFLPADDYKLSNGTDSLDLIELALGLESEYSIFIDYDVCIGWESLNDIVSTVVMLIPVSEIIGTREGD